MLEPALSNIPLILSLTLSKTGGFNFPPLFSNIIFYFWHLSKFQI